MAHGKPPYNRSREVRCKGDAESTRDLLNRIRRELALSSKSAHRTERVIRDISEFRRGMKKSIG